MLKEIDIAGIYFAPFGLGMVFAVLLFIPVRWFFDRIEIHRFVWHRPLFDLSVFVILLCLTVIML